MIKENDTQFKLWVDGIRHFTDFLWDLCDYFLKFPELGSIVFGLLLFFLKFLLCFFVPGQNLIILFDELGELLSESVNFIVFGDNRKFRFGIGFKSASHVLDFLLKFVDFVGVGLGDGDLELLFGWLFEFQGFLEILNVFFIWIEGFFEFCIFIFQLFPDLVG